MHYWAELQILTCCCWVALLLPVPQRPSLLPPRHDQLPLPDPHYSIPADGRGNAGPRLEVWRIWLPSSTARRGDWRIWVGVPGRQLWIWCWLAALSCTVVHLRPPPAHCSPPPAGPEPPRRPPRPPGTHSGQVWGAHWSHILASIHNRVPGRSSAIWQHRAA